MSENPFKPGQRVQFSEEAYAANIPTMRATKPDGWKGTVLATRGPLSVKVQRDGYKVPSWYHVAFWEPLRAQDALSAFPAIEDPMSDTTAVPNPGSEAARAAGCNCPREQPRAFQGLYWQHDGCPMHGARPTQETDG